MAAITVRTFTPDLVVSKAASVITQTLLKRLGKGSVLLLLSGGSAIEMYRQVFQELSSQLKHGQGLTVSLFDERYVTKNSPDSNALQLEQAGVLDQLHNLQATWWPYVLDENVLNESGDSVAQRISNQFSSALGEGKQLVILAGLGDDGHTAGLLPTQDSQTIQNVFQSNQLIKYYQLPADVVNPYRWRLTSTPTLIGKAAEIIVYATGEKKHRIIQKFLNETGEPTTFPALTLKTAPAVSLITDQDLEE